MAERLYQGKCLSELRSAKRMPPIRNWNRLKRVVSIMSKYMKLGLRTPEEQERYRRYMAEMIDEGMELDRPMREELDERGVLVKENAFPYGNLIDGLNHCLAESGQRVVHVCVWSGDTALDEEQVDFWLRQRYGESLVKWVGTVHDRAHRSIPDLWHAHVFAWLGENGGDAEFTFGEEGQRMDLR